MKEPFKNHENERTKRSQEIIYFLIFLRSPLFHILPIMKQPVDFFLEKYEALAEGKLLKLPIFQE